MSDFLHDHYEEVEITPTLDLRVSAEMAIAGNVWVTLSKVARYPSRREVQALFPRITDADTLTALGDLFCRAGQELRRLQMCERHGWDRDGNPRPKGTSSSRFNEPIGRAMGVGSGDAMTVLRDAKSLDPEPPDVVILSPSQGMERPLGSVAPAFPDEVPRVLIDRWGDDPDGDLISGPIAGVGNKMWVAWCNPEFGWSKWHHAASPSGGAVRPACGLDPSGPRTVTYHTVSGLQARSERGICKNCLRWLGNHGGW